MMAAMDFRIEYDGPREALPPPELYDGYDADSAFYDFIDTGVRAMVVLGPTRLELTRVLFVDFLRSILAIGESLLALPAERSEEELHELLPEVPAAAKIYSWLAADWMMWIPLVIFATDGAAVWIYSRTRSEEEGYPLIVKEGRDRAEPVIAPRPAVAAEIHAFLTRVFDDLAATLPFITSDALYRRYRERIDALQSGSTN